jgi:hypothetical protein
MSFSGKSFHVDFLNELHTLIWWFRHCFSGLGLFVDSSLSERKAGNYNRQPLAGSSALHAPWPARRAEEKQRFHHLSPSVQQLARNSLTKRKLSSKFHTCYFLSEMTARCEPVVKRDPRARARSVVNNAYKKN